MACSGVETTHFFFSVNTTTASYFISSDKKLAVYADIGLSTNLCLLWCCSALRLESDWPTFHSFLTSRALPTFPGIEVMAINGTVSPICKLLVIAEEPTSSAS